jgi:hypothetical protein
MRVEVVVHMCGVALLSVQVQPPGSDTLHPDDKAPFTITFTTPVVPDADVQLPAGRGANVVGGRSQEAPPSAGVLSHRRGPEEARNRLSACTDTVQAPENRAWTVATGNAWRTRPPGSRRPPLPKGMLGCPVHSSCTSSTAESARGGTPGVLRWFTATSSPLMSAANWANTLPPSDRDARNRVRGGCCGHDKDPHNKQCMRV